MHPLSSQDLDGRDDGMDDGIPRFQLVILLGIVCYQHELQTFYFILFKTSLLHFPVHGMCNVADDCNVCLLHILVASLSYVAFIKMIGIGWHHGGTSNVVGLRELGESLQMSTSS